MVIKPFTPSKFSSHIRDILKGSKGSYLSLVKFRHPRGKVDGWKLRVGDMAEDCSLFIFLFGRFFYAQIRIASI